MSNELISIPEYFSRFIDPSVDLNKTPKICCPFHDEDTPSFSYSSEKGIWRCFGACKVGGDVIEMHRKNFRLPSREAAEDSLRKLLGLGGIRKKPGLTIGKADLNKAQHKSIAAKAALVATTVDDWIELDYIMSQYPPDDDKLTAFYNCRRE